MSKHFSNLGRRQRTVRQSGRGGVALLLFLSIAAASAVGRAGDKKDAERYFNEGKKHYNAESFERAIEAFQASVEEYPTVSGYFNLANCQVAAGKYADAMATLEEMEQTLGDEISPVMKRAADELKQTVKKTAGRLKITVTPDDATIFVDDTEVRISSGDEPLWLAPGTYRVKVEKEGFAPETTTTKLDGGERVEVHLILKTPEEAPEVAGPSPTDAVAEAPTATEESEFSSTLPAEAPEQTRTGAITVKSWIALGGTVALAAACGTFYGLAAKYAGDFDDAKTHYEDEDLPDEQAPPYLKDQQDFKDKNTLFKYMGLGFAIGAGAMAVTTAVLMTVDKKRGNERPVSLRPEVFPGGGNLTVRF